MRRLIWTSVPILVLLALTTAEAGIFSRKDKPAPAVQVMDLLKTLKNAPEAGKRADAAEELREFDAAAFPEIVPVLINALQSDSSSSVRKQAAESLGKIKPTSVEALQALEQAEKQDDAMLVRWKARTAQLGYRAPQKPQGAPAPAAAPQTVSTPPPPPAPVVKIVPGPSKAVTQQPTRQLPTPPPPAPKANVELARPTPPPLESGPILDARTAIPTLLSRPVPKSAQPVAEDGPILIPPKR
jgi:hypothetical protein